MVRGRWLPHDELEARLADVAKHNALPKGRWDGAPPLAVEGKVVHQAQYDMAMAGTTGGEERLVVGLAGGQRVIVGQIVSVRYEVARKPDRAGHRAFAVTATQGGTKVTGELVVDTAGFVVAQTLGPPVNTSFTRKLP
jgi:hypothetical protein